MDQQENYFKQWENLFLRHRPFLLSFAFRMTGSLSEAEDIVQETFLECGAVDPATIQNHKSWLTKVCSNKGLDLLKIAYKKREAYHGPWLPDAVPDSMQIWNSLVDQGSPEKNLELSESLTTSFLLLLERLTPEERAVYLLSEIFDYPFSEVAKFLEKSEDSCRKMAQRARESVSSGKTKFKNVKVGADKVIAQFFDLARQGDKESMVALLAEGSEFWSDGGGKVAAAASVFTDPAKIAAFFIGLGNSKVFASMEFKQEFHFVNSRPGLIISRKVTEGIWEFDTIFSFEIVDGKIARMYAQRNPDKLKTLVQS